MYIFLTSDGGMTYSLIQNLAASDGPGNKFSSSLSVYGSVIAVGAYHDDDKGRWSGMCARESA